MSYWSYLHAPTELSKRWHHPPQLSLHRWRAAALSSLSKLGSFHCWTPSGAGFSRPRDLRGGLLCFVASSGWIRFWWWLTFGFVFFFGFRSLFSDCESHQPTHLPSWIMNRSRLIGWTLSENPYSTHYSIRLLVGSLVGYNPLKYRVDFDSDPIKNPWIVKSQNSPTPAKLPWNS